ncbi:YARHG domain-containing protein [Bosea sp. (in: a-proteobacteria)]|uniref:YARHG domain-containing protein n=1 Tax=Bosea sp. (in: a-proteobacteria) TaxID=1871050 RepID=UPI002FC7933B
MSKPVLLATATAIGLALPLLCAPTPAAAQSCEALWYQRNEIYKAQGYCFRTQRGIRAFGNAGCQYDDVNEVPLSARQREQIAWLQREERAYGCPR